MKSRVVSIALKGEADPDSIRRMVAAKVPRSLVQVVREGTATNGFYVEMIAAQTLCAAGTSNLLARKPEVDLLLRLAGTTQISKAISKIGARKGEPFLLVVAGPARALAKLNWKEFGGAELETRTLSPDELDRIESAALLNVEKA